MTIHRGFRWLAGAASCALVVSCHKSPPAAPAPTPQPAPAVVSRTAPPPPPAVAAPTRPAPAPALPTEEEVFARLSLADLNSREPLDDTFFGYDLWELSEASRTSLVRNAAWLRRWTETRVLIEGHADERGTSEYNLALGERRAAAARDYLVDLGVEPSRINIVTKGKEAPFCSDPNENCWRMNRRGHFIITAK